eukprot:CAMPEP_0167782840 /NCGR_PEP_ID=MMETSP0111_2-20121227/6745_1 /TAXON_ID=91324 /ORGANISM="Lotharella globosa, Strain CCCM811" /LENGTH=77 /DNA_ID=CAMNT_0007673725 /DNA_START=646 /DNA_END=877 /DNA_ORIENTATION=-
MIASSSSAATEDPGSRSAAISHRVARWSTARGQNPPLAAASMESSSCHSSCAPRRAASGEPHGLPSMSLSWRTLDEQ